MDNPRDEIDDLFRQRFEGLKDHSVSPGSQWPAFQSQWSAQTAGSATTAVAGGTTTGSSLISMAAAVGSIVVVAGISTSDKSLNLIPEQTSVSATILIDEIQVDNSTRAASYVAADEPVDDQAASNATSISDAVVTASGSVDVVDDSKPDVSNLVDAGSSAASIASTSESIIAATAYEGHTVDYETQKVTKTSGRIALPSVFSMSLLSIAPDENSIVQSDVPSFGEPSVSAWKDRHSFFLRAGLRLGSGESNSYRTPALWSVNGVFTGGYRLNIDRKFFVTAEAGWLRRSGNGIERTRKRDVSSIAAVVSAGYGANSGSESVEVTIDESLIGYRMDYLHIPIALHMTLGKKSSGSVGMFTDYMVAARNEAYIIYNSDQYVLSDFGVTNNSMDGLNRFRYGVLMGYDYDLHPRLTMAVSGMVPINSPLKETGGFRMIDDPNKLIELQIGLKYNI